MKLLRHWPEGLVVLTAIALIITLLVKSHAI